jgi:glycerol-3-phosphate acyltransferase PlsX
LPPHDRRYAAEIGERFADVSADEIAVNGTGSKYGCRLTTIPRIAIDAMGGDDAPGEIVEGTVLAHRDGLGRMTLVGDRERIAPLLVARSCADIEIVHATGEIAMDASASQAGRKWRGTSLGEAVELVRTGGADAVVSAGNSGAFLAIALIQLRAIPGIDRPAIAAVLPGRTGPVVLVDAGANVDCRPEWMMQFGIMGAAYARAALGVANPRVGIISNGEERKKGNAQSIEAAALLANAPLHFIGNVEGKDVLNSVADVVVADGFVGNVMLKLAEGVASFFQVSLNEAFASASPLAKLGGLLARPAFAVMKRKLDYDTYGGAPLLGVRGNCIVAHGRANRNAIRNAIKAAALEAGANLVGAIAASVEQSAHGVGSDGFASA